MLWVWSGEGSVVGGDSDIGDIGVSCEAIICDDVDFLITLTDSGVVKFAITFDVKI